MKLVEIDEVISENPKKVYDIFYKYCFGHQENSVQIISYLIDNYIPKVYMDDNNNLIIPFYINRDKNKLAHHPFLHECSYQAFQIIFGRNTDWSSKHSQMLDRRLKIFILVAKHFSNVLNEYKYLNGYGYTAIQMIALKFNPDIFIYYPLYFQEFVKKNIIDKYNLLEALPKIKKKIDWGTIPPKINDFSLYTNNLVEYSS